MGFVCELKRSAGMVHTQGNSSVAILSQLGLERFTHPGEPLLIHKGRQLVLPFAVDYDTYSSSTLSLTVKLFQSGGISVTVITSKVSCGCLPSGHVSLL